MDIIIKNSPEEVATAAADVMSSHIQPNAKIGLATGSTPLAMYQELIRRYKSGSLSFAGCTAFLLDEYIGLPKSHEQSYYRFIRDNFTSHIDIEDALVFSPDGEAEDPRQAGEDYDRMISEAGGVDIQLLGIGTDGHVGFNEPGSSLSSHTRVKVLHPQTIKDNARFFGGEESNVPIHVLTQGLGTISRAGHLLLIATGQQKAAAVRALIEGPVSSNCPASILQLHRFATVVVDNDAASLLEHADYYRFAQEHKDVPRS